MNDKVRVAAISVTSNAILTFAKVLIGFITGSVSILSEGIHSGIDLIAAFIAFFAVKESGKPADSSHAYGHGKIENVSGTIESVLIFIAALMIICEAIQKLLRIINGEKEYVGDLRLGLVIMGFSAFMNLWVSTRLKKVAQQTDSVALEADALHLRTDVYTSVGVFSGLLLIEITGWTVIDPVIALGVASMIIKASFELSKEAFSPLVDESLPKEEREIISQVLQLHAQEFVEFHELRTRKSGAERQIDLHLVVPKFTPIVDVHELCDTLEREINEKFQGTHILIHAEPCSTRDVVCPQEGSASSCRHCPLRKPEKSDLEEDDG